jgi:predicted nucleic acid-binding protein
MILDTAFLIELLREDADAFQTGVELSEANVPQRIPSPVLFELKYGTEMEGDEDEQRAIENLPRLYPIVRLNDELAFRAAELSANADKAEGGAGQSGIDSIDPMVAAIADTVDEPVLTRNADDFEKLGVAVETF